MKTALEKAKELIDLYDDALEYSSPSRYAQECALISVNNEIVSLRWLSLLCTFDNYMKEILNLKIEELKEVKQEIEKLKTT